MAVHVPSTTSLFFRLAFYSVRNKSRQHAFVVNVSQPRRLKSAIFDVFGRSLDRVFPPLTSVGGVAPGFPGRKRRWACSCALRAV